ncbi:MAG TPA: hypothetical protein DEP72_01125 [Clostridiales bacterium]|nr:MAG: hypothetical protein A2Y18_01840 [Clostridiales bacterium GWD2_32_19]HCC06755.1 hypothetical protein [Clostridiales bacterium]
MKDQKVWLVIGISCLIFGIMVAYITKGYLPAKNKEIEARYAKDYAAVSVFMIADEAGLYSNTMVTEELFTQKTIVPVLVPTKFIPTDSSGFLVYTEGEKADMLQKRTNVELVKGAFVLKKSIGESTYPDDLQYKRRKEYTFKNNVAGEVKTGSMIDVLVNYLTGDYDVVIPKIKVEKVVAGVDGTAAVAGEATTDAISTLGQITVILSVDEMQFRDIELAEKMGNLQSRVYEDEEQAPSLQTFKYSEMKNLVKQIADLKNLSGDIDSYSSSAYIGFYGDKWDIKEKLAGELSKYKESQRIKRELEQQKADAAAAAKKSTTVKTVTPVKSVKTATPIVPETQETPVAQ